MKELERLKEIEKELKILDGTAALLYFDQRTLMPAKAAEQRAEQFSYITAKSHSLRTSKETKKIIKTLSKKENYKKLSEIDRKIVDKYKKKLKKLSKLPVSFVEELSKLTSDAHEAWAKAREVKDFRVFAPFLEKIVEMKKKQAKLIDAKEHPYNVLLDDYEEGMTIKEVNKLFSEIKPRLIKLINEIKNTETYKKQKDILAELDFPFDAQRKITTDIRERMLLEDDRTATAETIHPFMTRISADDVRVLTAYRTGKPMFSFTSTVHEAGHALYELGFPENLKDTILFDAPSYAMHESQSRFWEIQIALRKEFWDFYYSIYKKEFPSLKNISEEEFYRLINQVKPHFIRIESDELTYPLHIIIRYELEIALLEGKLKVKDLSEAWNKKYQEYLGITPRNDTEGVLQDSHWSSGDIGYFPTYLIGTVYSAMFFNQMTKDIPNIKEELRKGNLKAVLNWLRKNIHCKAATKLTKEIVKEVCGKEIDSDIYINYLKDKFENIYMR